MDKATCKAVRTDLDAATEIERLEAEVAAEIDLVDDLVKEIADLEAKIADLTKSLTLSTTYITY
jgi:phage shock protein A